MVPLENDQPRSPTTSTPCRCPKTCGNAMCRRWQRSCRWQRSFRCRATEKWQSHGDTMGFYMMVGPHNTHFLPSKSDEIMRISMNLWDIFLDAMNDILMGYKMGFFACNFLDIFTNKDSDLTINFDVEIEWDMFFEYEVWLKYPWRLLWLLTIRKYC